VKRDEIESLKNYYVENKGLIKKRINEFEELKKLKNETTKQKLIEELIFCLLTPQTKATAAFEAVQKLKKENLLCEYNQKQLISHQKQILGILRNTKGIRFHNNKTKNVLEIQEKISKGFIEELINSINSQPIENVRNQLHSSVKGYGLKEASHFLRNIGQGKEIAILNRHILNNLKKYEVIQEIPKTITTKKYFEIENQMKNFSKKIKIPLDELDLVFWSKQTGNIFK
jgi:N-glycosylase/DNA lyase